MIQPRLRSNEEADGALKAPTSRLRRKGIAEKERQQPLCPQSRGTAKKGVIGEGKLPDSGKMALVNAGVAGENKPAQRLGQHIKAVVEQVVGFAVDVLHVDLLFAQVVVEVVFGRVGMPVQSQDEAVGQQHPQQHKQQEDGSDPDTHRRELTVRDKQK